MLEEVCVDTLGKKYYWVYSISAKSINITDSN